jgi:hypothetical protein
MIHVLPENGGAERSVVSGRSSLPRWWASSVFPKAIVGSAATLFEIYPFRQKQAQNFFLRIRYAQSPG